MWTQEQIVAQANMSTFLLYSLSIVGLIIAISYAILKATAITYRNWNGYDNKGLTQAGAAFALLIPIFPIFLAFFMFLAIAVIYKEILLGIVFIISIAPFYVLDHYLKKQIDEIYSDGRKFKINNCLRTFAWIYIISAVFIYCLLFFYLMSKNSIVFEFSSISFFAVGVISLYILILITINQLTSIQRIKCVYIKLDKGIEGTFFVLDVDGVLLFCKDIDGKIEYIRKEELILMEPKKTKVVMEKLKCFMNKKHWTTICCLGLIVILAIFTIFLPQLLEFIYTSIKSQYAEYSFSKDYILSYYGQVLSFIGTISLGVLALWQNKKIKNENDKAQAQLMNINKKLMEIEYAKIKLNLDVVDDGELAFNDTSSNATFSLKLKNNTNFDICNIRVSSARKNLYLEKYGQPVKEFPQRLYANSTGGHTDGRIRKIGEETDIGVFFNLEDNKHEIYLSFILEYENISAITIEQEFSFVIFINREEKSGNAISYMTIAKFKDSEY